MTPSILPAKSESFHHVLNMRFLIHKENAQIKNKHDITQNALCKIKATKEEESCNFSLCFYAMYFSSIFFTLCNVQTSTKCKTAPLPDPLSLSLPALVVKTSRIFNCRHPLATNMFVVHHRLHRIRKNMYLLFTNL